MANTRRSAIEMVQALERWGLERWPQLRPLFEPLREAAAQEAAAQATATKPKGARRATSLAPPEGPSAPAGRGRPKNG
jgi:hypothetical protein